MQRHILTLLAILILVALTSGFNQRPIGPRGEALDAFLETLPGPILLGEKSSRSFVFINAADHPHLLVEFARRIGLPEDLMAQVFELPDQGSVPTGLTNAILVSEERLFEPADRTLMAITPIALNGDRTEALFGTIYDVPNETRLAIVVVWMKLLDGEWVVHKTARMA